MCLTCPDNWYGQLAGIILAAFFLGIGLVLVILWLNLTVAVGTLNPIIFYANLINLNQSLYFEQSPYVSLLRVFISWLNLDIGFNTCFYEGMDIYAKTWLQLAFPAYIFFLVVVIIFISSRSTRFSKFLGQRNPVATLATLIQLSYTKLLQVVITSLAPVILRYPNGTTAMHWLPDASIAYNSGQHLILICVAIIILVLGLLYTFLIFSWQWLLRCPRSVPFKWIHNQKLHSFINTYHTPLNVRHRYWTGLHLIVRVIVYLTSAFLQSQDPRITLLATIISASCLILYKTLLTIRAYKNWLLNTIESIVYFNLATFAAITWYSFDSQNELQNFQTVISYIFIGGTLILFIFVLIFHVYRYASAKFYSWCLTTRFVKEMQHLFAHGERKVHLAQSDRDAYHLFEVTDNPQGTHRPSVYSPFLHEEQAAMADQARRPMVTVLSISECEGSVDMETPPTQIREQEHLYTNQQRQNEHHQTTEIDAILMINKASTLPGNQSSEFDILTRDLSRPRSFSHGSSKENRKPRST